MVRTSVSEERKYFVHALKSLGLNPKVHSSLVLLSKSDLTKIIMRKKREMYGDVVKAITGKFTGCFSFLRDRFIHESFARRTDVAPRHKMLVESSYLWLIESDNKKRNVEWCCKGVTQKCTRYRCHLGYVHMAVSHSEEYLPLKCWISENLLVAVA